MCQLLASIRNKRHTHNSPHARRHARHACTTVFPATVAGKSERAAVASADGYRGKESALQRHQPAIICSVTRLASAAGPVSRGTANSQQSIPSRQRYLFTSIKRSRIAPVSLDSRETSRRTALQRAKRRVSSAPRTARPVTHRHRAPVTPGGHRRHVTQQDIENTSRQAFIRARDVTPT